MSDQPLILHVNADAVARRTIGRRLVEAGFDLREATSLDQGLAARKGDLVLLGPAEWRRVAEEVERRRAGAPETDRRRDESIVRLAREIRDPLGALNTACEALADAGAADAVEARLRGIIGRQMRRLASLVESVLEGSGPPAAPAVPDAAPASSVGEDSSADVLRASRAGPKLRILLVEDHKDAREGLRLILELWGHDVDAAPDGARGIALAVTRPPDVALIDLGLPRMDGFEVARRLRQLLAPPPCLVALTGSVRIPDRERAREAGFDAHLAKPVDARQLANLLASPGVAREAGR